MPEQHNSILSPEPGSLHWLRRAMGGLAIAVGLPQFVTGVAEAAMHLDAYNPNLRRGVAGLMIAAALLVPEINHLSSHLGNQPDEQR